MCCPTYGVRLVEVPLARPGSGFNPFHLALHPMRQDSLQETSCTESLFQAPKLLFRVLLFFSPLPKRRCCLDDAGKEVHQSCD